MSERLTKKWEVSAYDHKLGEWTTTMNHAYEETEDAEAWQAAPAIIRPSRRQEREGEYNSIFVYGDAQIGYRRVLDYETNQETLVPLHDERKIRVMRALARAIMPNLIVNVGDNIDLGEFSRFAPDSDQFLRTLAPSFQRVHNMYAELRADHPNARILEVSSNHNERLNKAVMKGLPQAYGVTRPGDESKYPILSYPYMANLEHVGVEWVGGYPSGEFIYKTHGGEEIRFAHGTETSSGLGTAAAKTMRNHPETHNVQGHDHKTSEAWHTTRDGRQLGSFVLGAIARTDGVVPSYHSSIGDDGQPVHHQENWQGSVMEIRDYEDGTLEFNRIMINGNGTARYEKRLYEG